MTLFSAGWNDGRVIDDDLKRFFLRSRERRGLEYHARRLLDHVEAGCKREGSAYPIEAQMLREFLDGH